MFDAKSLELPGRTLGEVLDALVDRGGSPFADRVYADAAAPHSRELDRDLRLLVNGRNALFLDGLDTTLVDADVVTVHFAGSRAFPGG